MTKTGPPSASAGRFNLTGSVGVRQWLYSEPARANYQVEGQLQHSREEERNQLRLDIIQDAAIIYLRVLRAKTVERIQKSNLELTRQNLELALSRRSLGAAGPDEVYRWEIQIANNRKAVIEANAVRKQAEIALNRVVNHPLEEPFQCQEDALDDTEFVLSYQKLEFYVDNEESFAVFRKFMVREGFSLSPDLRRLDALITAQQRALLAARRSYYMPELSAQADLTGNGRYWKSPAFSPGSLPPGLVFPMPGRVDWTVGFRVSLPIFTSGARRSEVNRLNEELAGLNVDRDSARQRVEQRIRTALHTAGASHAGIDLANAAAGAPHKNMALITDSYSRGAVDIIKLLDAQNQALQADLSAANAIYDFLIHLMGVQRAVGRFDFFVAPGQEQAFFKKEGFRLRRRR